MPAADDFLPDSANPGAIDRQLLDILRSAADDSDYTVRVTTSGGANHRARGGFHPQGKAVDVQLIDPNGRALPNYQDPAAFPVYEQFAQRARAIQQERYPGLDGAFRWGGYFGGPLGKYGALDTMHFDLGGSPGLGMAGGDWERGLNDRQRSLFPGIVSVGRGGQQVAAKAKPLDLTDLDKIYGTPLAAKDAPANSDDATPDAIDLTALDAIYGGQPKATAVVAPPKAEPAPAGHPGALANAADDGALTATGKNVATGLVKGVGDAAGIVDSVDQLAGYLLARTRSAITGKPVDQAMAEQAAARQAVQSSPTLPGRIANAINPLNWLPTSEEVGNKLLSMTGEYVPDSMMGRAVQTGARAVTGSFGPGSVGAVRGAATAPVAAVDSLLMGGAKAAPVLATSGAAGQIATDVTGDPLIGMAASAAPGVAGAGLVGVGNRLMGRVSPETASLAQTARDHYGIPVTAGDMAESRFGQYLASTVKDLPLSGAGKVQGAQRTAFNQAVAQTFGETADKITPQVMARARDRIGSEFEAVAQQTPTISLGTQGTSDIMSIVKNASGSVTEGELKPIIQQAKNIVDMIDRPTGTISGEQYQALTRKGAPLDKALSSSNPNIKAYASDLREVLDSAFDRSASPELTAQLQTARSQWKSMRTIEDLVAKSPDGDISPALLQGRVNAKNKGTYGRAYGGGGDLGELAAIGQRFMKEPPNSGTAPRSNILNMLGGAGATAGAIATQNPLLALGSVAAPIGQALAGRVVGGRLRSDAVTQALIARSMGQGAGQRVSGGNKLLNLTLPYALEASGPAALPRR